MARKEYKIQDWAGNTLSENGRFYPPRSPWLHVKRFLSFNDAWGYLYEKFDGLSEKEFDEEMGEYYVEEVRSESPQRC